MFHRPPQHNAKTDNAILRYAFGVRQLAAAFFEAGLLAVGAPLADRRQVSEQARLKAKRQQAAALQSYVKFFRLSSINLCVPAYGSPLPSHSIEK